MDTEGYGKEKAKTVGELLEEVGMAPCAVKGGGGAPVQCQGVVPGSGPRNSNSKRHARHICVHLPSPGRQARECAVCGGRQGSAHCQGAQPVRAQPAGAGRVEGGGRWMCSRTGGGMQVWRDQG